MSEHEIHQPDQRVSAPSKEGSSYPEAMDRREFIAMGGVLTALAAMGITVVAVKLARDRQTSNEIPFKPSEEDLEKVSHANDEYRTALQKCLEHPSQETAEILNGKSMVANSFYFALQPDLSVEQRLTLGVDVADLNERAVEAIEAVTPQTRYTQLYLDSINRRQKLWELQATRR